MTPCGTAFLGGGGSGDKVLGPVGQHFVLAQVLWYFG